LEQNLRLNNCARLAMGNVKTCSDFAEGIFKITVTIQYLGMVLDEPRNHVTNCLLGQTYMITCFTDFFAIFFNVGENKNKIQFEWSF
jgi:hypothetical protein